VKIPEDNRIWIGGGVAAAVLVLALSWFFVFGPKLSHNSDLRDQADSARTTNDGLNAEIAKLKAEQQRLPEYTARLRRARNGLPITDALPAFAKSSHAHAQDTGVSLRSMTVQTVTPISVSGEAITAPPASTGTAPTAGSLFAIPVTLVSNGAFDAQLRFLSALQKEGPRVILITGTRFSPGDQTKDESVDKHCSMTTNLTVFVAPQTPQEAAQLEKQLAGSH
jgi:hypothetical protein